MDLPKIKTLPNARRHELGSLDFMKPSEIKTSKELVARIREITRNNTFTIDDHWDDYIVLNSSNPFEILYLYYDDSGSYSDNLVAKHYNEIKKFLDQIMRNSAIGIDYKSSYPMLNPEVAIERVNEAWAELRSHSGREQAYKRIVEQIKTKGKLKLNGILESLLIDEVLTPEESSHYVKKAISYKFSEEEALELLHQSLVELKFVPVSTPEKGESLTDKFLNTKWVPEHKIAESRNSGKTQKSVTMGEELRSLTLPDFVVEVINEVKVKADLNNISETTVILGEKYLNKLLENLRR